MRRRAGETTLRHEAGGASEGRGEGAGKGKEGQQDNQERGEPLSVTKAKGPRGAPERDSPGASRRSRDWSGEDGGAREPEAPVAETCKERKRATR